jgi:hypothetical protein
MKSRAGRNLVLFVALALFTLAGHSHDPETAYWVWQREDQLNETELAELSAQNVHTIYWQVGELENVGETWRWKVRFAFPARDKSEIRYVPVVRLVSRELQPFSAASLSSLTVALSPLTSKCDELQLDYDAPGRLLGDYAAALKRIHRLVPRLTITALPHWSRTDCLSLLEPNIDELLPMLYDFEPQPLLKQDALSPLIDPDKMQKMLSDWGRCHKPWRAGLPVFARLTVYDANGKSRGQIRNWNWDELCFNAALENIGADRLGTTVFRVGKSTSVSNTPLHVGDQLAVRRVDRVVLQNAIAAARQTTAQGIVLFRLPDSTAGSGWSLNQVGHLDSKPELILRKSDSSETLEVQNRGDGDLEPGFTTREGENRGYLLELKASTPIFREAEPGDFVGTIAYVESDDAPKAVAVPFATRIAFKFSHLKARQSLRTGLIQLAPGADFRQIRYQIRNVEGGALWKPIK